MNVRREWEHTATPVAPATIAENRVVTKEIGERLDPRGTQGSALNPPAHVRPALRLVLRTDLTQTHRLYRRTPSFCWNPSPFAQLASRKDFTMRQLLILFAPAALMCWPYAGVHASAGAIIGARSWTRSPVFPFPMMAQIGRLLLMLSPLLSMAADKGYVNGAVITMDARNGCGIDCVIRGLQFIDTARVIGARVACSSDEQRRKILKDAAGTGRLGVGRRAARNRAAEREGIDLLLARRRQSSRSRRLSRKLISANENASK